MTTKHALVVCDLQPDLLGSIQPVRQALLDLIAACARNCGDVLMFTGVRFDRGYPTVSPNDKIYGGFRRLAAINPDSARWFVDGEPGAELCEEMRDLIEEMKEIDACDIITTFRSQHLPTNEDLIEPLKQRQVTHATVVGIKTAYAVQAVAQALCSAGIVVSFVRDCVADDVSERQEAIVRYMLPCFATSMSISEYMDARTTGGLDAYKYRGLNDQAKSSTRKVKFYSDCGRGGHFYLIVAQLKNKEPDMWQPFPTQTWYEDILAGKSFQCPLGRHEVDFCDEPRFSRTHSMFLKGREWLDEKEKLLQLVPELMPPTYRIERRQWVGEDPTKLEGSPSIWFLKETNKNGGRAVEGHMSAEACLAAAHLGASYVVQPHIPDPVLTNDGHKCHVKFYSILKCDANDANAWHLYTYRTSFLCISPNVWSPTDTDWVTQVTVLRDWRLFHDKPCSKWPIWPAGYKDCRDTLKTVVERAVSQGKLQARTQSKSQFEIFCADFMWDVNGRPWLIECNFSPVLFDAEYEEQALTTRGLNAYRKRIADLPAGDLSIINDHAMLRDAVGIGYYGDADTDSTQWEHAGRFPLPS